ncbi:MAG: ABC transporter permease [Elioraea sp.]|nr:ABC transporter permease [Elioraea sp.]
MSGRRVAGAVLFGAVAAFAALGPEVVAADPARQSLAEYLTPPGGAWLLGTDHLGRSLLARLAHAARLSLFLAAVCVFSAALPGTLLGILAAWAGGLVDRALSALADAVLALPGLLLVLLIASFAPGRFWPLQVGFALTLAVEFFRVVRGTSQRILAGPAVEASRLLGFGPLYIVRRHLWPDLAPLIGTLAALSAAACVLGMAALGFVGIGLRPPEADWGLMMTELFPYHAEAPWAIAQPIALLFLTVLGLLLLAGRERA